MDPASLRSSIVNEVRKEVIVLVQRKLQAAEQVVEDMVDMAMHTITAETWCDEFFQSTEKVSVLKDILANCERQESCIRIQSSSSDRQEPSLQSREFNQVILASDRTVSQAGLAAVGSLGHPISRPDGSHLSPSHSMGVDTSSDSSAGAPDCHSAVTASAQGNKMTEELLDPRQKAFRLGETWLGTELKGVRFSGTWAPEQDQPPANEELEPEPELAIKEEEPILYPHATHWARPRRSFGRRRSPEVQEDEYDPDDGNPLASP